MFLELSDRVAVVTGGASGIGYAISDRLSRAGARVVIADREEENAVAAAEHLGGEAVAIRTDVTSLEDINAMVERTLKDFGRLDVLVNNAGINGRNAPLWEVTDEEWEVLMAINLTSVFRCCRAAVPHMCERGSGSIINMASIGGKEGNANAGPYGASKAAVICLTKSLAKEVIHDGVRVNAIAPALIETPILKQVPPEDVARLTDKIPMGRMGRPEEVAAVVHFLASDDASFVTAQCYDVSGGRATY